MSSKRRHRPETEGKSGEASLTEHKPVRAAWRSAWRGDTHIIAQSRPFSTLAGIFLILYLAAFVFLRFDSPDGPSLFYLTSPTMTMI